MPTLTPASLPLKGNGASVTVSTPLLDLTQTWNAAGVTFTGIRSNITDTASAAGSLLLDLQVAGSSRFNVTKSGQMVAGLGVQVANNGTIGWTDTTLSRDAANTVALRNGVNAQTFRAYNTFTDASNYERVALNWASNVATLTPENAGTGSARILVLVTGVTTVAALPAASAALTGARAFVSDANASTFGTTAAAGGANKVPVTCDGTAWKIG